MKFKHLMIAVLAAAGAGSAMAATDTYNLDPVSYTHLTLPTNREV